MTKMSILERLVSPLPTTLRPFRGTANGIGNLESLLSRNPQFKNDKGIANLEMYICCPPKG
jgi:hypothetical protein